MTNHFCHKNFIKVGLQMNNKYVGKKPSIIILQTRANLKHKEIPNYYNRKAKTNRKSKTERRKERGGGRQGKEGERETDQIWGGGRKRRSKERKTEKERMRKRTNEEWR